MIKKQIPNLKQVFYSLIALLGALLLLLGRYNWSDASKTFAWRSFLLSAFLLVVVLPVIYSCLSTFLKNSRLPLGLTLSCGLLFSLPYRWLGLDGLYYHLKNTLMEDWRSSQLIPPATDWFPEAFRHFPTIPGEATLFGVFFLSVTAGMYALSRFKCWPKKMTALALIVGALIPLQTWAHLSLRSPYTYIPHFEQPAENHYWYHYTLFPNGKGAVNLDYHAFRPGEELFIGLEKDLKPLCTRSFPTYLASQFTAFFNPYYVWLLQNMLFWLLAVGAIYLLALRLFGETEALFAALLMASSQSVILYVAQPKVYATAICMLALTLAFQQEWFSQPRSFPWRIPAFAGLFFLFLLSYEAQPWMLGILMVAYVRKWEMKTTTLAILGGCALYFGFVYLCKHLPHLAVTATQSRMAGDPGQKILKLILSGDLLKLLKQSFVSVRGFGRCLLHCFQLCTVPALFGLISMKGQNRKIQLALLLAPFLTYAYFEMGEDWLYTQFPRLVMLAYPAIYLCAGYGLAKMWNYRKLKSFPLGKVASLSFVVINFIYLNIDVWGHPWIYYLWFYRNAGHSLQP